MTTLDLYAESEKAAEEPEEHRRSLLRLLHLEPEFCKRQLVRLTVIAAFGVVISAVILGFFYNHILDQLVGSSSPLMLLPEEIEELSQALPGLYKTLALWLLLLSIVSCITTLTAGFFMVSKLAGPLVRLKHAVAKLGDGDLSVHVELRKGDEFQDLAQDLNSTLARIQLMVMASKENLALIEELQNDVLKDERLALAAEGLHDALGYFQTVEPPAADSDETQL